MYYVEWETPEGATQRTGRMTSALAFDAFNEAVASPGHVNPRIMSDDAKPRRYVQVVPPPENH